MIGILTTCLFAAAGLAAITAIIAAMRQYAPEIARLREQIAALNDLEQADLQPSRTTEGHVTEAGPARARYDFAFVRKPRERFTPSAPVWLQPNLAA